MIELVPRLRREPEWQPESAARPRLGDYLSGALQQPMYPGAVTGQAGFRVGALVATPDATPAPQAPSLLGSSPGQSPLST